MVQYSTRSYRRQRRWHTFQTTDLATIPDEMDHGQSQSTFGHLLRESGLKAFRKWKRGAIKQRMKRVLLVIRSEDSPEAEGDDLLGEEGNIHVKLIYFPDLR